MGDSPTSSASIARALAAGAFDASLRRAFAGRRFDAWSSV